MPRGQKSKSRSRAKRQHARSEGQSRPAVQPTAEEEAASPPGDQGDFSGSSPADASASQGEKTSGPLDASVSCAGASAGAAEDSVLHVNMESLNITQVVASIQPILKDPIMRKASMLIEFLLDKFKMKEPVTRSEMLAVVNKKYKLQFSEILRRTSARLEIVFGLELKEIDANTHTYMLVGKLGLSTEGNLSSNWGLPRTGLLMTILGVIFMNGNRATEKEVWEFLNRVGVHAGRKHIIFGEPREFVYKDLVEENYLEYRRVPGSDPPSYEFLWGSRAYAETTKMKVLEVLAKVSGTVPTAFPNLYQLALKDQALRARKKGSRRSGTAARPNVQYKAQSRSSSHI